MSKRYTRGMQGTSCAPSVFEPYTSAECTLCIQPLSVFWLTPKPWACHAARFRAEVAHAQNGHLNPPSCQLSVVPAVHMRAGSRDSCPSCQLSPDQALPNILLPMDHALDKSRTPRWRSKVGCQSSTPSLTLSEPTLLRASIAYYRACAISQLALFTMTGGWLPSATEDPTQTATPPSGKRCCPRSSVGLGISTCKRCWFQVGRVWVLASGKWCWLEKCWPGRWHLTSSVGSK